LCAAITFADREETARVMTGYVQHGLRVLAVARRVLPARSVGIGTGTDGMKVVTSTELDAMIEHQLDDLLGSGSEVVFARSPREAKLRIADARARPARSSP
jgi:magnesium-transporting ATPase (P-type)